MELEAELHPYLIACPTVPTAWFFRICLPPTAPPTAAPTIIKPMTNETIRNVLTFMPKIMRGGRLSLT